MTAADKFCFLRGNHVIYQQSNTEKHLKVLEVSDSESTCWPCAGVYDHKPIYCREPVAQDDEVFPEIWYRGDCYVTGIMHAELSRILLAAFDPKRPKIGIGCTASARALAEQFRASILRICGIALHNRGCPPTVLEALMGITICGEYFDRPREQDAVIAFLEMMKREYAYPADSVADMLKWAWSDGICC